MNLWLKGAAVAFLALSLNLSVTAARGQSSAAGTWKWSFTTQNGQTYETTMKLKQDGNALAGVIVGRNGTEIEIQAGKIQGSDVSFQVSRERNGQTFTTKYKGVLSGDTIKGTMEFERDGQTNSREWEAKRAKPPVSATGTWKWSITNQNGDAVESTLKLKQDGEKVTGTLMGRRGETAIEEGKMAGDEITFQITRERNGEKFVTKYAGKISGDAITGKITSGTSDQPRTRDWAAKREKAVNIAGTWQWTMERNGQTIERRIKLTQEGDKLAGVTIFNNNEVPLEEVKLQGDEVSFQVTRERDGNKFTIKYRGKLEGDSIKGKINANFGGDDQTFDWDAKRVKE